MADLGISGLKTEVDVQIYTNHQQAITGAIMNDTLIDTIDTLKNGGNLDAKSVDTAQLADGAVEALQINNGAVIEAKIASGAVTGDKIATGAVTHAKIGADAVDGSNIQDGSITELKIYEGSINEGHLQMNCVTEEKIATDAVIEAKIAASAVTNTKIASGAVIEAKIGAKAVTREKIADDAASYVEAIKENVDFINVDNLGDVRAKSIDMDELPKVCGFSMYIISTTAPNVAPDFISQHWIDTVAKKVYIAVGVSSAADFVALN
jgi:hypothetical protein